MDLYMWNYKNQTHPPIHKTKSIMFSYLLALELHEMPRVHGEMEEGRRRGEKWRSVSNVGIEVEDGY